LKANDDDIGSWKASIQNLLKNPVGKIVRKDYLLTAVEIAKKKSRKGKDAKLIRDPPRGKTFYCDDNTTPYGIALSWL